MENLIVENQTSSYVITEIEAQQHNQTVKKVSVNIHCGNSSQPIPLDPGIYTVIVTVKNLNGNTGTLSGQVGILGNKDTIVPVIQFPPMTKPLSPILEKNGVLIEGGNQASDHSYMKDLLILGPPSYV